MCIEESHNKNTLNLYAGISLVLLLFQIKLVTKLPMGIIRFTGDKIRRVYESQRTLGENFTSPCVSWGSDCVCLRVYHGVLTVNTRGELWVCVCLRVYHGVLTVNTRGNFGSVCVSSVYHGVLTVSEGCGCLNNWLDKPVLCEQEATQKWVCTIVHVYKLLLTKAQ